MLRRLARHCHI